MDSFACKQLRWRSYLHVSRVIRPSPPLLPFLSHPSPTPTPNSLSLSLSSNVLNFFNFTSSVWNVFTIMSFSDSDSSSHGRASEYKIFLQTSRDSKIPHLSLFHSIIISLCIFLLGSRENAWENWLIFHLLCAHRVLDRIYL